MNREEIFGRIIQTGQAAIAKIKVRSAVNPCLWLCGLITPISLISSLLAHSYFRIVLLCISFMPIIIFAIGYFYFMVKNPDKLQSEDYQLRKQALELIETKGSVIPIEATSVQAISNPELFKLPSNKEEE